MAYGVGPLLDQYGDDTDYGDSLEALSLRSLRLVPADCAFIRWDLMVPPWRDDRGELLDVRLQELRMNASTRERRFRKAGVETFAVDTMVVDLRDGWDAARSRMDYRTRYSMRLAERRGTAVKRVGEAGLEAFQYLYGKTAALRGLARYPASCYRSLFRAGRDHGLSLDLYLAEAEGLPVAAAIFARHEREAWYLFAGSDPAYRAYSGPTAILGRALHDYAEAGVERLDLLGVAPVGTSVHPLAGLSLFKSGFGGERRSRAGSWDFVIREDIHASYACAESLGAVEAPAAAVRTATAAAAFPALAY
jgi:hypothetical protein